MPAQSVVSHYQYDLVEQGDLLKMAATVCLLGVPAILSAITLLMMKSLTMPLNYLLALNAKKASWLRVIISLAKPFILVMAIRAVNIPLITNLWRPSARPASGQL